MTKNGVLIFNQIQNDRRLWWKTGTKPLFAWWRHQMETFSALLAFCVGNSPVSQRPVTRSFDVFFDLRPNKRLSKQSWGWWFGRHLAHYDVSVMCCDCISDTQNCMRRECRGRFPRHSELAIPIWCHLFSHWCHLLSHWCHLFSHDILQDVFTSTGTISRLPWYLRINPRGYG